MSSTTLHIASVVLLNLALHACAGPASAVTPKNSCFLSIGSWDRDRSGSHATMFESALARFNTLHSEEAQCVPGLAVSLGDNFGQKRHFDEVFGSSSQVLKGLPWLLTAGTTELARNPQGASRLVEYAKLSTQWGRMESPVQFVDHDFDDATIRFVSVNVAVWDENEGMSPAKPTSSGVLTIDLHELLGVTEGLSDVYAVIVVMYDDARKEEDLSTRRNALLRLLRAHAKVSLILHGGEPRKVVSARDSERTTLSHLSNGAAAGAVVNTCNDARSNTPGSGKGCVPSVRPAFMVHQLLRSGMNGALMLKTSLVSLQGDLIDDGTIQLASAVQPIQNNVQVSAAQHDIMALEQPQQPLSQARPGIIRLVVKSQDSATGRVEGPDTTYEFEVPLHNETIISVQVSVKVTYRRSIAPLFIAVAALILLSGVRLPFSKKPQDATKKSCDVQESEDSFC